MNRMIIQVIRDNYYLVLVFQPRNISLGAIASVAFWSDRTEFVFKIALLVLHFEFLYAPNLNYFYVSGEGSQD